MATFSKTVIAWGDGLIHDYLLDVLKRRRVRSPGDEYSRKQDDNITDKLVHIPESGFGSATRDPFHERTPGDAPDPASGYIDEQEIYGDAPADDESKPGGGRRISPRGEPPVSTPQQVQLMSDDPVTINNLFQVDTQNRDRGSITSKTRQLLKNLYNGEAVRFKHKAYDVDAIA